LFPQKINRRYPRGQTQSSSCVATRYLSPKDWLNPGFKDEFPSRPRLLNELVELVVG
jgi:hypothetical protein